MPLRGTSPKRGPKRAPWPGTAQGGSPQNNVGPQGGRGQVLRFLAPFRVGAVLWPDEDLPPAVASVVDEEGFQPPIASGAFARAPAALIERAEEWIASIPVDDDYSDAGKYRGYAAGRVFTFDEDAWIASIAIDDDYSAAGRYRAYPTVAVFTGDDDAWMASIGVDEDPLAVLRAAAAIIGRLVLFDEDGLPPQAAPFGLDEDQWQSPVFLLAPAPRPFVGDEEWAPSIPIEDEGWIAVPFARVLQRLVLLGVDDAEFVLPAFTLDDDPWMPAIPRGLRAPAGVFAADEDGAPMLLDDEGWYVIVPRLAKGPRFAFDDAEMLAIAAGIASDPRYIVHLASRGFSGAQGAREFEVDLEARSFTGTATVRTFTTAEGGRRFVVTLMAPRT